MGPFKWYWLSFADDERFLGLVIIFAEGFEDAIIGATALGLNPGGQVYATELNTLGENMISISKTMRLLSEQEALELADYKLN